MPDMKLQDMKLTAQVTGHENAGHEIAGHEIAGHANAGHEFAIHDKYRMKIYYITVQCAFFNFKSFVCTASVLTSKT